MICSQSLLPTPDFHCTYRFLTKYLCLFIIIYLFCFTASFLTHLSKSFVQEGSLFSSLRYPRFWPQLLAQSRCQPGVVSMVPREHLYVVLYKWMTMGLKIIWGSHVDFLTTSFPQHQKLDTVEEKKQISTIIKTDGGRCQGGCRWDKVGLGRGRRAGMWSGLQNFTTSQSGFPLQNRGCGVKQHQCVAFLGLQATVFGKNTPIFLFSDPLRPRCWLCFRNPSVFSLDSPFPL